MTRERPRTIRKVVGHYTGTSPAVVEQSLMIVSL